MRNDSQTYDYYWLTKDKSKNYLIFYFIVFFFFKTLFVKEYIMYVAYIAFYIHYLEMRLFTLHKFFFRGTNNGLKVFFLKGLFFRIGRHLCWNNNYESKRRECVFEITRKQERGCLFGKVPVALLTQ